MNDKQLDKRDVEAAREENAEIIADEILYDALGKFPNCVNGWAVNYLSDRIASALRSREIAVWEACAKIAEKVAAEYAGGSFNDRQREWKAASDCATAIRNAAKARISQEGE